MKTVAALRETTVAKECPFHWRASNRTGVTVTHARKRSMSKGVEDGIDQVGIGQSFRERGGRFVQCNILS
jgi:hypothetical protein